MTGASRPAGGFVMIARKMFDGHDPLWESRERFDFRSAWIDLIQLAVWKEHTHVSGFGIDALQRGEFVASLRFLGARWGWGKDRASKFLDLLENLGRIRRQRNGQHGTVYLLCNYDTYNTVSGEEQTAEQTAEQTPSRQRTDTSADAEQTKKKKEKKEKKNTMAREDLSDDEQAVIAHYTSVHPKRRPGAKDLGYVRRALGWGYSAADLCEAIDGNARDEWHRARGKHELEYVLRDNGKIDGFRARAERSVPVLAVDPDTGLPNAAGLAALTGRAA